MRATKLLLGSGLAIISIFLLEKSLNVGERVDLAASSVIGAFEFASAGVSLYLLSKANLGNATLLDWLICGPLTLIAGAGFASISISLFALYLIVRGGNQDLNLRAAGTVAFALSLQAIWAPLIFAEFSFLFLQIDAGIVGWLISQMQSGASWNGAVVYTSSGHNVEITAPCASFHNLSLASLCWVTLTMLHRPYWLKGDLYVGLLAAAVQFGFNVWRLVFVCSSLPMYEFWHEGLGKHIFSATATASAIILVQMWLLQSDDRVQRHSTV